jgi:hypothetical protein
MNINRRLPIYQNQLKLSPLSCWGTNIGSSFSVYSLQQCLGLAEDSKGVSRSRVSIVAIGHNPCKGYCRREEVSQPHLL